MRNKMQRDGLYIFAATFYYVLTAGQLNLGLKVTVIWQYHRTIYSYFY